MKIWADLRRDSGQLAFGAGETKRTEPFMNPYFYFPLGLGIGIWLYFSLPFEPTLSHSAIGCVTLVIISLYQFKTNQFHHRVFQFVLFIFLGFVAAQIRTWLVAHDTLPETSKAYKLKGELLVVKDGGRGRRHLMLRPIQLGRLAQPSNIGLIRLATSGQSIEPNIGDVLCTRAMLRAPRRALSPGYYNPARSFYFKKIGAIGFNIKAIKICGDRTQVSSMGLGSILTRLRHFIRTDISLHLTGDSRALTKAIVIGDRGGLRPETYANIRFVGLAHLLAISGLHMGLFVGSVFVFLRLLFALSSHLALNFPIKKWAAMGALISGFIYLNIAGGSVSTQRAFVMASIMMIAILCNRPAISFSNIALAASLILLTQPEQLLTPGFQMSFAASIGLIALYNRLGASQTQVNGEASQSFFKLKAIFLASLVGSAVTAPFALYHFNHASYLGLFTNVFAIPFFSLCIMPLCVLYLATIPLGLSPIILPLLAWLETSFLNFVKFTAGLDLPVIRLVSPTSLTILLLILVIFFVWKWVWERGRLSYILLAISLGLLAIFNQLTTNKADIYISGDNKIFALRDGQGKLQAPDGRKGNYALSLWLKHDGDPRSSKEMRHNHFINCDETGCKADLAAYQFYKISHYGRLEQVCRNNLDTKILILDKYIVPTKDCLRNKSIKAMVTDRDLKHEGGYFIYVTQGKPIIKTVANVEGHRPWNKKSRKKLANSKNNIE